ncbi:ZZ-type zinc finger-containing protein 3 isoform X2 [Callorhinchus milii]|uniref:ZZ-type zinc finger-containing protein 3 isoform X2 n=1 Tax=Callorhinchus milii TaxID=7868 RepID=UPI00045738B0|nr:ZZ-type zinc finger-containing protein 3 isoform X2 [Callorhinchus milii]|eukprot:gi/632940686/ref/XP_007885452.1/ PREDICTED: ZZ-type zinc finger-containing protein 3 isoform X2 [Callorhinchus milii]
MAAFRSQRVTRSSVGSNGLDENFCGRTLRNRSIVHSEDSSPLSHLRSRSPKKKQDGIQQQKGTNGGRVTECKQQSVRESWVSPRKRGLSCSEKDNNEKKALDICDTVSPVFKRVKRCSRSETIDGSEDVSPVKNEKQPLERKSLAVNNDGDSSQLKRARRFLLLDDCDKREVKKGKDLDNGQNSSVLPVEVTAHQTSNGINEKDAAVPEFSECESIHLNNKPKCVDVDTCTSVLLTEIENSNSCDHSVLLNGSKIVTVSEPDVPCTDSEWEGYSIVSDCPSVSQTSQSQQSTAVLAIENPSQIRESEEEVDVVGDSSCQLKEQCFENANCSIDTAQDIEQFSGVTDSSAVLDSGLVPLAEPQEHRYALRTSPRRAAAVKCSPQKINSPLRDNGQPEDKIPSLNEMEKAVGTVAAGTEHCMEFEEDSQSKRDLPQDSVGECFNGNMSDLPTDLGLGSGHLYTSRESSSQQTREEEEEEPDVYYFESDHVALKHNKDYQRLLQTIAVLEAQRAQAVQDLENLSKHQKEALKDPITFVENLQQKIDMELPCSQRVVQLPQIPWDHYTSGLGNFEKEYRNKKHNTRRLKLIFDKRLPLRPKSPVDSKKDGESSSSSSFYCSTLPSSDTPEVIRGRICDDSKSETYNQLWSIEEQKRLEELLLKYPPEEVETRRWQKVADELGSRTAKQVASRVQKYFIKLAQAGIPVPGRTPNLYLSSKKASNRQQHPLNKHLFRPSTFMTSHQAPVYMDDEDDRSSFYSSQLDASADCEVSDDESIPPAYRLTPEYKELLRLKKMKKHKLDQMQAESGFVQHIGFKCDNCGTDPILGVRWHCQDCPPDGSVDFCDSCSDCLYETESHKGDHQLEPIYRVETFLDRDYCLSQSTGYNYLDPNYYPANR